ncbi:SET domain-containing protein [Thozetella sp. PMI_491]|nr:SET domain-containing protein [Thozetella sp. PMI_491]
MSRQALPIEALPAWSLLNDITFVDVKVADTPGQGYGLLCERNLTTENGTYDIPTLITVPRDMVLNAESVEQYAKEDRNFRQLLDAAGHKSARGDILLFLLVQLLLASGAASAGVSNPWTEYIKFLPSSIPLPTLWSEEERALLQGTSLEAALAAKLRALNTEFDDLQEITEEMPFWSEVLWEKGSVSLRDWIYLDALYRSRVLELPRFGDAMVPCIDMVNHSGRPRAYYEVNEKDEVALLLQPSVKLSAGDEVTISYGQGKSPAEMLFSYGFLETESPTATAVFPLEPFSDDPLARAKLVAFSKPPQVSVSWNGDRLSWTSSFAYLMCVNEEDGLDFKVLQDNDGSRQLRVFWQEEDVTDRAGDFENVIQERDFRVLLRLRVVTAVQECLLAHVESMQVSAQLNADPVSGARVRDASAQAAARLRAAETAVLQKVAQEMEDEKSYLMADGGVMGYLGLMEDSQTDLVEGEASNEDEDFS